jgi:hypothetical protein
VQHDHLANCAFAAGRLDLLRELIELGDATGIKTVNLGELWTARQQKTELIRQEQRKLVEIVCDIEKFPAEQDIVLSVTMFVPSLVWATVDVTFVLDRE